MRDIFEALKLKNRVILAPMAGITDKYFRKIVRKYEKDSLIVTEMIHSMILIMAKKDQPIADITDEDHPISMQIFGHEPEYLAKAAKVAQDKGFDAVDINMACPTRKIVKNGDGSGLLLNPELAEEIMQKVVDSVSIPVTVKIRAGWDEKKIVAREYVQMAQKAGLYGIAIHARTKSQFYSGEANWDFIKYAQEGATIPVIGNGDIWECEDAAKMMEHTNCKGIMSARGTLGNPWFIKQLVDYMDNKKFTEIGVDERFNIALEHLDLMIEGKGEKRGVIECRKHLLWYTKGLPNSSQIRRGINTLTSRDEIVRFFNDYRNKKDPFDI